MEGLSTASSKNPTQGAHEKTPVQLLSEYCVKTGAKDPVYVWGKDGDPFAPTVACTVTVGDVIGTGEGTRKQIAKQNAAATAWARLQPEVVALPLRQVSLAALNPVGTLQELAVKKGVRPPQYLVVDQQGQPHETVFTMTCQYDGFEATGTGPSKQKAKHGAASNVLAQLEQARGEQGDSGLQAEGAQGSPVEDTAPPSLNASNPSVSNGFLIQSLGNGTD